MSTARRSVPDSMIAEYEAHVKSMKSDVSEASAFKFDDALAAGEAAAGDEGGGEAAAAAEEADMYD